MLNFDAHFSMPGQVLPELKEVVNKTGLFFGRADRLNFYGAVIDNSAADAGNTGYTSHLRPGLLMGRINTAGGDQNKWKHWDPTATDGSQIIGGILAHPLQMSYQGSGIDRLVGGWICVSGGLRSKGITVPSLTSEGIVGIAQEWNIRRQINKWFQLDDMPMGLPFGVQQAKTANYTVLESDCGMLFTNTGASGTVNFTLPVTAKQGLEYEFQCTADQTMTITAGTADTMITLNDLAADSVSLATSSEKIGGGFRVIGTGSTWLVIPRLWEAQTVTVVTA
jgi:hypothetical protein